MTRDVARRLSVLLLHAGLASAGVVLVGAAVPACYSGGGGGTNPPTTTFYFPVGLAVSSAGNALYAVNSDFDLQWNGGTLQSYDLFLIRRDTAALIQANATGMPPKAIPFFSNEGWQSSCNPNAAASTGPVIDSTGTRISLGQTCAPPVNSATYVRDSAIIGAFATDLQLGRTTFSVDGGAGGVSQMNRLFAPVRGDATLTWANVPQDDQAKSPPEPPPPGAPWGPFALNCGQGGNGGVCDASHHSGNNANEPGDTRLVTMPGEPFAMAQTEDGTAIAVTHQSETEASLFLTAYPNPGERTPTPSMQFVLENVVNGGSGLAVIPHDPSASVPPCEPTPVPGCVRPAFLETSRDAAEIDLLRYYNDDGSSLDRPFLTKESAYTFNTNFGGTDSRGIAIDSTPRIACKAKASATSPASASALRACGQLPARVFFANRTPPSLVIGSVGAMASQSANGGPTYDPDLLTLTQNIPLPAGPSRVYLAPIVNQQNQYELRVFVVNFDSNTISVFNPDPSRSNLALVDTIYVGPGPFAMAFDPFALDDVANNAVDKIDSRQAASSNLKTYRFAYVASFTQSFVQVIDLDESEPTFENVVFTLGKPTSPKGT